jgi:hypothetical protein
MPVFLVVKKTYRNCWVLTLKGYINFLVCGDKQKFILNTKVCQQ